MQPAQQLAFDFTRPPLAAPTRPILALVRDRPADAHSQDVDAVWRYVASYQADPYSRSTTEALQEAFSRIRPIIEAHARHLRASPDELQEAHLAVAAQLHGWRPPPTPKRPAVHHFVRLLVRRAVMACRAEETSPVGQADRVARANRHRKAKGLPALEFPSRESIEAADEEPDGREVVLEEDPAALALDRAMQALPGLQRAIVAALHIDGVPIRRLARAIGLQAAEVRELEAQGLAALREAVRSES